jgi:hypothetical protein
VQVGGAPSRAAREREHLGRELLDPHADHRVRLEPRRDRRVEHVLVVHPASLTVAAVSLAPYDNGILTVGSHDRRAELV